MAHYLVGSLIPRGDAIQAKIRKHKDLALIRRLIQAGSGSGVLTMAGHVVAVCILVVGVVAADACLSVATRGKNSRELRRKEQVGRGSGGLKQADWVGALSSSVRHTKREVHDLLNSPGWSPSDCASAKKAAPATHRRHRRPACSPKARL